MTIFIPRSPSRNNSEIGIEAAFTCYLKGLPAPAVTNILLEDTLTAKWVRGSAWLRTRISAPAQRLAARTARDLGDKARDLANWQEAATCYKSYLRIYPGNADLWVQLGNMLKESLAYDSAVKAYRRATILRPENAEPHLQLGHVRRRQGLLHLAAAHYLRAYKLSPYSSASLEIETPEIAEHLREKGRRIISHRNTLVMRKISHLTAGLNVIAMHDIRLSSQENVFDWIGHDSWIEFTLQHESAINFGVLAINIDWSVTPQPGTVNLFIDYGNGYSENRRIDLDPDGTWPREILLASPLTIRSLRFDPDCKPNRMRLASISYRALDSLDAVLAWVSHNPHPHPEDAAMMSSISDFNRLETATPDQAFIMQCDLPTGFSKGFNRDYWNLKYPSWISQYITPDADDYRRISDMTDSFAMQPKFSFVMPVYNPPIRLLCECIESMLMQTYSNFEICIADDNSPNPEISRLLLKYSLSDSRIKIALRSNNGHISAASNSALSLATGDFIVLVDHDDLIPDYALFTVAYYINKYPTAKVLFSDEDKIDVDGVRSMPYFKCQFSEFLMFGHNMVSHLGIYRSDLIEEIGGFRLTYEGSQDYDLFMRCYDRVHAEDIVHIPHVLYNWRTIPGSTSVSADQKGYAIFAAQGAINGYFERNGLPWRSVDGFAPGCSAIKPTKEHRQSVSIIIPTRDGLDMLEPCIRSILAVNPAWFEIIVVDNGSVDPATLDYLDRISIEPNIKVLRYPHAFNYSLINNFAVEHAAGEVVCFLNNDTEVVSSDWLDRARALLAYPQVGVVGARLLFPSGGIQHFGVTLGLGEHRVAGLPHAGLPSHLDGYFGKAQLIQEFSAVTAACMFIRRADFHAIGGFDAALRVAYNDIDLCLRLRDLTGLKIVCDPGIELIHKESQTRGYDRDNERARRLNDEAATMRARWGDLLTNDPYYSPNLSLDRADFALAYPPRMPMPWRHDNP